MECWNIGIVEYWDFTHPSIYPVRNDGPLQFPYFAFYIPHSALPI